MRKIVRRITPLSFALVAAVVVLGFGDVVFGQEVPQPDLKRSAPVWLGIAVAFVLTAVVMLVSLMPSKRGHQD